MTITITVLSIFFFFCFVLFFAFYPPHLFVLLWHFPVQVLAVDPDNGENGTVVYSISPENPFYTINSSTGKIRTSGATLDRETSNPKDAVLMRAIVVSAVDRECVCVCVLYVAVK